MKETIMKQGSPKEHLEIIMASSNQKVSEIHRTEKDGDWYIYPQFLAHKNPKKRSENFKPYIHNVVSTGMNFAKIWLSMALLGSQGIVVKSTAAIFFRMVEF